MSKLTDFLITYLLMRILCGRGPALFGLLVVLSIPTGLLLVVISALRPDGVRGFAKNAVTTIIQGLH